MRHMLGATLSLVLTAVCAAAPLAGQALTVGAGIGTYTASGLIVDAPVFEARSHGATSLNGLLGIRLTRRWHAEAEVSYSASDLTLTVLSHGGVSALAYDRLLIGSLTVRYDVFTFGSRHRLYVAAGPALVHRPAMPYGGGSRDLWAATAQAGVALASSGCVGLRVTASVYSYRGHQFGAVDNGQQYGELRQLDLGLAAIVTLSTK